MNDNPNYLVASPAIQEAMLEILNFERKRISLDIHDRVQNRLRLLRDQFTNDPAVFSEIQDILSELRAIAYQLVPKNLQEFSLVDYLNIYETTLNQIYGEQFKTDYRTNVKGAVPKNTEVQLFSIVQECVNNVLKHASDTPSLIIRYREDKENLVLLIQDFGSGFDYEEVKKHNTIGLKSIQIRCDFIGAELIVTSLPNGEGTKIKVSLPLSQLAKESRLSPNEAIFEKALNEYQADINIVPHVAEVHEQKVVLIVDNQVEIIEGLKQIISKSSIAHAYEYKYLRSVAEAKTYISTHKNKLGLIITDITMPDESGIQLVEYINSNSLNLNCVFYTINDLPAYVFQALKMQVKGYISKEAQVQDIEGDHPVIITIKKLKGGELDAYYSPNIKAIVDSFQLKEYNREEDRAKREIFTAFVKLLKDKKGRLDSKNWKKELFSEMKKLHYKDSHLSSGTLDRYFRTYKSQLMIHDDEQFVKVLLQISNEFGFFKEGYQ